MTYQSRDVYRIRNVEGLVSIIKRRKTESMDIEDYLYLKFQVDQGLGFSVYLTSVTGPLANNEIIQASTIY